MSVKAFVALVVLMVLAGCLLLLADGAPSCRPPLCSKCGNGGCCAPCTDPL